MASEDRSTSLDVGLLKSLQDQPYRHGFFSAVRRLECLYADKPRVGESTRPADEPVRFGQEPSLAFAPAELTAFEPPGKRRPGRLQSSFFGLLGPNGPLPHHLTEYARDRLRNKRDPTFSSFLDVFHHRMFSLFYRAWADAEAAVSFDRPERDEFARYLGSLFGQGKVDLRERDAMPGRAKLFYAGRLAGLPRHPDGLEAMLEDYFGLPAKIVEFVGRWMDVPVEDCWQLGQADAGNRLGTTALLGTRVWGRQQKFRIELGPMDLARYTRLLPGGRDLEVLVALVRNYVSDELDWDVRLILQRRRIPGFHLDGTRQMGFTTWLGHSPRTGDAGDLIVAPQARQRRVT